MPAVVAACPDGSPFVGRHVMLVVAHPDDEVLGASGQFAAMGRLSLVHLTDGAPSDRAAQWHGFADRRSYAAAREFELADALRISGILPDRYGLGLPDQQASFHMVPATMWLAELVERLRPDVLLTHPYEGGHPDHDATAFIVAAALRRHGGGIPLWEFASYHREADAMVTGRFLAAPETPTITICLDAAARDAKRRMRDRFASQREILAAFSLDVERFRPAPTYDFSQPPHAGRLLYESRRRAWTGAHWRRLATAAERRLAKRSPLRLPGGALYRRLRGGVWRAWLAI